MSTQPVPALQPIVNGSFNFEMSNEEVLALPCETKQRCTWNIIVSFAYAHSYRNVDHAVFTEEPMPYTYDMITPETVDEIFVAVRKMFEDRHNQLIRLTNGHRFMQGVGIHKAQKELSFGGFIHLKTRQLIGYLAAGGNWNDFDAKKVGAAIRELEDAVPKYYIPNNPNNGSSKYVWTCKGDYITMKFDFLSGDERETYLDFYKNVWEPTGKRIKADSVRYELDEHDNQYTLSKSFSLELIYWWD